VCVLGSTEDLTTRTNKLAADDGGEGIALFDLFVLSRSTHSEVLYLSHYVRVATM